MIGHKPATMTIRAIDLFCGAGGSSWGARKAGVEIVAGFDMWPLAGKVYQDNFPEAKFYKGKLEYIRPREIAEELGKIDLILASPECTNHSPAKGNHSRSEASRRTAFQVVRFARILRPRWIIIENVVSMKNWDRYAPFIRQLENMGYHIREQTLDAANFGVPQSRKRLYIICSRETEPAEIVPSPNATRRSASHIVNMNGKYTFSPLKGPKRAQATLERANRAIEALGPRRKFLLVYYSSDGSGAGGWQRLDAPLRTITTLDRFAFVKPSKDGYKMRMLQVPELRAAMGLSAKFQIRHGSRRDQIRLLGNAVCPPVMTAIVRSLICGDKAEPPGSSSGLEK